MIGKTWAFNIFEEAKYKKSSTHRAPLVAADKLKEEGEGGLEDADHEEGVQHPTRYEPFKGGQRAVENNFF